MFEIWLIGVGFSIIFHYYLSRTPQGEYFLDRVVDRGYIKGYHREKFRYAHVLLASALWFVSIPVRVFLKWKTGRWFKELI